MPEGVRIGRQPPRQIPVPPWHYPEREGEGHSSGRWGHGPVGASAFRAAISEGISRFRGPPLNLSAAQGIGLDQSRRSGTGTGPPGSVRAGFPRRFRNDRSDGFPCDSRHRHIQRCPLNIATCPEKISACAPSRFPGVSQRRERNPIPSAGLHDRCLSGTEDAPRETGWSCAGTLTADNPPVLGRAASGRKSRGCRRIDPPRSPNSHRWPPLPGRGRPAATRRAPASG